MNSCKSNKAFWCPVLDFAIHTGMRRSELLKKTWVMVHFDKMFITLPPEIIKTHKTRNVPLQPKALKLLRTLPRILFIFKIIIFNKSNF